MKTLLLVSRAVILECLLTQRQENANYAMSNVSHALVLIPTAAMPAPSITSSKAQAAVFPSEPLNHGKLMAMAGPFPKMVTM